MIFLEFIFALTIAFILTLLFALIIQKRGRRTGLFWFFWGEEITYVSLHLFFWVMVFAFITVIITRYVVKS